VLNRTELIAIPYLSVGHYSNEYGPATLLVPFVYYRSNFKLSMLKKPRNMTCTKRRYTYSFIGAGPTVYMCWVRTRNMTRANWRNPWLGNWHIYLCWIWSRNLTRANWRHSCSIALLASHLRWMWPRKINRAKQKSRELALDLKPICDNYELETWLAPTKDILVIALDMRPICSEFVSKYDLRQKKKFV